MAVLNYLFAKKNAGKIYFRSEDTDKERSKREYEDDIKEQLQWLGLGWDDFSRSTELVARHTAAMQKLVDEDKAYISEEESKKDPGIMVKIVRLRNPGKVVTFTDVIRGEITSDTTDLGDFVIGRSIDDPLYNFAVVVDDAAQGITHVIRGEDHISNTPRQIMIQEALEYPRPTYAHFPLHLASDRSKLSKRTGDVAVRSYREKGYLALALLNYLAILGWTPPSSKEMLSLDEMVAEFDLRDLHKSGAIFDVEKLNWYNRSYLKQMSDADFLAWASPILKESLGERNVTWSEDISRTIMPLIRENVSNWEDLKKAADDGAYDFFFVDPQLDAAKIPEKKSSESEAVAHLKQVSAIVEKILDGSWEESKIKDALWAFATENGRGAVLWPLRYALSGREKSPDPFLIASIIGKGATVRRIQRAIDALAGL